MKKIRVGMFAALSAAAMTLGLLSTVPAAAASAPSAAPTSTVLAGRLCPPSAVALSFSDALDKLDYAGSQVGGLSSLAYDRRAGAWASALDNHGSDLAKIWYFRDLARPTVVRAPLILRRPDGTPYNGTTSDNEGLAVLPDGDYLVSSETEPSIRIFGRDGIQKSELPVPARFAVTGSTPAGQATPNATLEGLTISPSGHRVIAAMEGALSGDVSAAGNADLHRFLVYDADRHGKWRLTKQVSYRTDPGLRVPEVAAYSDNSLVVEEASFAVATGNTVKLFAVTGLDRAADVSAVGDLSSAPARVTVGKTLVADLVRCPTLGATAKQPQTNPLLDNYEGMAFTTPDVFGFAGLSLISDDNFGAAQITRVLNLAVRLP